MIYYSLSLLNLKPFALHIHLFQFNPPRPIQCFARTTAAAEPGPAARQKAAHTTLVVVGVVHPTASGTMPSAAVAHMRLHLPCASTTAAAQPGPAARRMATGTTLAVGGVVHPTATGTMPSAEVAHMRLHLHRHRCRHLHRHLQWCLPRRTLDLSIRGIVKVEIQSIPSESTFCGKNG